MSDGKYVGEMAQIQRRLAQCYDMTVRRNFVFDALNLRPGQHVLEVGCGGGFYAYEAAHFVGPTGRICATDLSEDQIDAASQHCASLPWVECRVANAVELPYADATFDVIYAAKVLEYIPSIDSALAEIKRVLRPGGKAAIVATNWSSLQWYSKHPERMKPFMVIVDQHAPYPNLPAELPARLHSLDLSVIRQKPIPVHNRSYNENSYSYYFARMLKMAAQNRGLASAEEAQTWLDDFEELEQENSYFFSSSTFLTEAQKPR